MARHLIIATSALLCWMAACNEQPGAPLVSEVRPNRASNHSPAPIQIIGQNFYAAAKANYDDDEQARVNAGFRVSLDNHDLYSVEYHGPGLLKATVPAKLPPGVYDLMVVDPRKRSAVGKGAFTVTGPRDGGVDGPLDTGPDAGSDAGPDAAPADLRPDAPADGAPPDKPLPDKPLPDKPLPDKPLPDKPLPDKLLPDKPLPDKPLPDKPPPDQPWPDQPWPDQPWPPDLPLAPDTTPGVLFQDDFNGPGTGLQSDGSGTWTLVSGSYLQTTCNQAPDVWVPGKSWTDIKVTVKVRGEQVCGLGQGGPTLRVVQIAPGCQNKYYWCVADFDGDWLYMGSLNNSCLGSGAAKKTPSLQLSTWYTMVMSIKGTQLTCTLSGGNLASPVTVNWSSSLFASGSAGLVTDGLKASFDDFKVEPN